MLGTDGSRFLEIGRAGLDLLAEIVFPPTCAGCGSAGSWMCSRCGVRLAALDLLGSEPFFARTHPSPRLVARYAYSDPVRQAVHLLKYNGQHARAVWFAEQVAPLLASIMREHVILEPVPLTPKRERSRGFNQSREIARHLSERLEIPLGSNIARVRETRPQVELDGIDRIANVRGAFTASQGVAGEHVVLVDDVITTGSTMRECASACLRAGAAAVIGVAAAKGVD